MSIKQYKPRTAGTRGMSTLNYRELLSGHTPTKGLMRGRKRGVGRNAHGRITTRHKGGGHKRVQRMVDFKLDKRNIAARIASIEYDPSRSAFIGLAIYRDGEKRYIVLPQRVGVEHTVITSETAPLTPGNRLPLSKIPVGTFVYNIELRPGGGAKLVRSAGNFAEVVAQTDGYAHLKMPSSEVRRVIETAWASIGEVSNPEHRLVVWGKAGRNRWRGKRPTVRGTAMNPVDHPHGGGEGRQGRGHRRARSMWGKPTGKGQKTRRPKKYSNVFVVSRRKVGRRK